VDEAGAVAAAGEPGTITSTNGGSGREPDAVVGGVPRYGAGELARFGLTEREREVFLLLATGLSNPQIGKALFISPKTVSVHVSSILAKLGVTGRIEAAAVAHRLGIVGQQP
jgi:DNA-binding NarL/FixJ family response regulator